MPLNLHDVQGVEVRHKQEGLSVGWSTDEQWERLRKQKGYSGPIVDRQDTKNPRVPTEGQGQTAPSDVVRTAPPPVRVHEHAELCQSKQLSSTSTAGRR